MVLRSAERVAAQVEAAHERQRPEALRLTHDLVDQRRRLPAAGREQDTHARLQAPDRLLDA